MRPTDDARPINEEQTGQLRPMLLPNLDSAEVGGMLGIDRRRQ
jgi:hypothetical protein